MAYIFHKNAVYGQTTEGRKVDILRKNPLVCFQVGAQIDGKWGSVMCRGSFEELDMGSLEAQEAKDVFKLLTERLGGIQEMVGIAIPSFSFGEKPAALDAGKRKSTLFRIVITEKTGRLFVSEK